MIKPQPILWIYLCSCMSVLLLACMEVDPSVKYDRGVSDQARADVDQEGTVILNLSDAFVDNDLGQNFDQGMLDGSVSQVQSRSLNDALEPSAESCLGPWMCRDALGCVNGECGGCLETTDCPQGMVCEQGLEFDDSQGTCVACGLEGSMGQCAEGMSCVEGVCLDTKLRYYRVDIDEEAWRSLRSNRYQDDLKAPCLLQFTELEALSETPIFESVYPCKIRVHGGSSRDFSKLSWRLTFDEPIPDVTWGDDRITLRGEYNDLSLMRNALGLSLFEQWTSIPTSRWRYVWLNINGEEQGVYFQVEKSHSEMMRRWGRDPSAPRYEADIDIGNPLERGASGLIPLPSIMDYWAAYQRLAGVSYAPLIYLIEEVIGTESKREWLETRVGLLAEEVHLESYLRYIAVMRLIQNLDSIRKNYLISLQSLGGERARWEVYPWDLDLSWGCLFNDELGSSICDEIISDVPLNFGETPEGGPPTYPADGFYNMLTDRSLSPRDARTYYESLLCELARPLEENIAMKRLFRQADALRAQLTPWVTQDSSYRGGSIEQFHEAVDGIKLYWEARRRHINDSILCPP